MAGATINEKDPVVLDEIESLLHEQNMYWINSIFMQCINILWYNIHSLVSLEASHYIVLFYHSLLVV